MSTWLYITVYLQLILYWKISFTVRRGLFAGYRRFLLEGIEAFFGGVPVIELEREGESIVLIVYKACKDVLIVIVIFWQ